jgi:signal transduction histidine kinase
LRNLDRMKSEFLARMSHELRTPLNAVLGFTKFTVKGHYGPTTDEMVKYLNAAIMSGEHLLMMINDILDTSKIESGNATLFIEEDVNLQPEIASAISMGQSLIKTEEDKHIELVVDIAQDLPLILGDKRCIKQILINFVTNAVKFTEFGFIYVTAKVDGDMVSVSVRDTGVGIQEHELGKIFAPFEQAAEGKAKAQGTGLGLSISKKFIEAHRGKILLESEYGVGTTFTVLIPIRHPDLAAAYLEKKTVAIV